VISDAPLKRSTDIGLLLRVNAEGHRGSEIEGGGQRQDERQR
jgi:hypothetical protein